MGKAWRTRRALGLVAVLGMATACTTPYGQAMRKARAAEDLGNERSALAAYREACAHRSPGHRTCLRADELTETLAARAVEAAEAVCLAGHVDRCADRLGQVAGPATDHPDVARLIERSQQAAVHWDAKAIETVDGCIAAGIGEPAAALKALACVQRKRQGAVDRPAFRDRLAEHAPALAAPFRAAAAEAAPGGRYGLETAAACLDPSAGHGRQAEARADFLAAASRPLVLRLDWSGDGPRPPAYDDVCARVAAEAVGLTCGEGEGGLIVEATIHEARPVHTWSEREEAVRYQSGTRVEHNPDYDAAERRLERAEWVLAESEPVHHEWEAACESARRNLSAAGHCHDCQEREDRRYDCDRAERAKDVYERHRREVVDARRTLGRTPTTLEIAEYDVHRYTERHHRWSVDYVLDVRVANVPEARESGTYRFDWDSVERPGFAAANVTRVVRTDPPPGHFSEAIAGHLVRQVGSLVRRTRASEAPDPEAACQALDLGEWMDCRAEVALSAGRLLERAETVALLAARLGVSDPLPACR